MARAIWKGSLTFGLVNVPVKLYSAVSKKTVRFNQLNAETGNRIQQKRVDPETGEEVGYDQIVKGVLWVTHKSVASQEYHAENKGENEKTLVIEHPLRGGWKLIEPEKPAEKTESLYRFRQKVAAGES